MSLRIGTRGSALALAQARQVAAALTAATHRPCELVVVRTHGDVSRASLAALGGTGVFVGALREALAAGACDVLVHSMKDLPVEPAPGLVVAAVPGRADARDALCARDGLDLAALPAGARVGTGSPRRRAQLAAARPDLTLVDVRGNVDTRLTRVGTDLDAVLLSLAGLTRLGRAAAATQVFDLGAWPTAAGQGALAIEVRAGEQPLVLALDEASAHAAADGERAVLGRLQTGCAAPVGVASQLTGDGGRIWASVYAADGQRVLRANAQVADVAGLRAAGSAVADELLAAGAADLAPLGGAR